MRSLQLLICITFVVCCNAEGKCPQGWTIFEQGGGKEHNKQVEALVNSNRQKYHDFYPGHNFGYLAYNEPLGRHADAYIKSCNIDYLLANQQDSNNYNVSRLHLNSSAYFWHVTSERDCTTDWDYVMGHFFDTIEFDKLDQRCYVAQLKDFGCAFNCFEAVLTPGKKDTKQSKDIAEKNKKMYIRSYVCNYEVNCDSAQDVSEKCMNFCDN